MTKSRRETDNARDTQYSIGHVPKRIPLWLINCCEQTSTSTLALGISTLLADGATHPACGLKGPISPRFTPMIFYRDAGSALLHHVNQWLNLSYSHVFTLSTTEIRRKLHSCWDSNSKIPILQLPGYRFAVSQLGCNLEPRTGTFRVITFHRVLGRECE